MSSVRVALYGNGLFNQTNPSPPYSEQIQQLMTGGYTTVLLWSIHVHSNGDFYYNDTLLVSDGVVQLGSDFAANVNALVAGGVKEILLSVGAWGTESDFANLQETWDSAGAANLKALCAAFPVTAVDFDYESQSGYTSEGQQMIVDLTLKISALGIGVTYCPYTAVEFWMGCLKQSYQQNQNVQPVLWLNLQCYAGGVGNDPNSWIASVKSADAGISDPGAFVVPGYWVAGGEGSTCPSALQSTFEGFQGSGIIGGFLWNSSDMFQYESLSSPSCGGGPTYPANYASAIVDGLGGRGTELRIHRERRRYAMSAVHLTSQWFIRPGCEKQVLAVVPELAAQVQANEPDTLTYLVHTPFLEDSRLQSLPPADPVSLLFFEVYRSADAFLAHVNGKVFTDFVNQYGELFVQANGKPYTTVFFLSQRAGFVRNESSAQAAQGSAAVITDNQHPSVMFEIIGRDQGALQNFYTRVFGWNYQAGSSGFAYVNFPLRTLPLMGGIGQASSAPGFEPGRNFYLLVDDLQAAIDRAVAAGGSRYMDPASADGYHFAMVRDPEGNPIGLIKPFTEKPA